MKKIYLSTFLILLIAFTSKAQWAGGLIITTEQDGVSIKINNVKKGKTPLRLILKPATYTIIAEKPSSDYTRLYYKGRITVTNGKIDDLKLKLEESFGKYGRKASNEIE